MISLLNRICRGIEDAWTSGFIQVLIIVLIAYGVVSRVVSVHDDAEMRAQVEQHYNTEHHTNIHLETDATRFHLGSALWDEALPMILIAFIIAYEVRRRIRLRSASRATEITRENK